MRTFAEETGMNLEDVLQAFVNNPGDMFKQMTEVVQLTITRAVAAERERSASKCNGLAIAAKITGGHKWSEAQRDAVTTAAEWLASEIRKGEPP